MKGSDAGPLQTAAADVAGVLRQANLAGMLIGGLAVIARGVERLTKDADFLVSLDQCDPADFLANLESHGVAPRVSNALDFARVNQVFLMRHVETQSPIDISLAWLPYELEAIQRARNVEFAGAQVPTAMPGDLIILKAVAWRPQDLRDISILVTLHGRNLDLVAIRTKVQEFAEILEAADRLTEFDALVKRARGLK